VRGQVLQEPVLKNRLFLRLAEKSEKFICGAGASLKKSIFRAPPP
jgi:hypothetical protein